MKYLFSNITAAFILLPTLSWAITPLDETSLDNVSAETSSFILDIYGKAAAGLKTSIEEGSNEEASELSSDIIDLAEDEVAYKEGDAVKPVAEKELESIETKSAISDQDLTEGFAIDSDTINEVLKASDKLEQTTQILNNVKNIRFKDHHHHTEFFNKNSIRLERSTYVELLELQQLQGDDPDSQGFGDLFLSNWESRGSAHINTQNQ